MSQTSIRRTLYSFNETIEKLKTDDEGFRQALCYQLQNENECWIRACIDSRGSEYLATFDGSLSQRPHVDSQTPALDEKGETIPSWGNDQYAQWAQRGSDLGTGYGAVYALAGIYVVNPQNVRWIAEEAGLPDPIEIARGMTQEQIEALNVDEMGLGEYQWPIRNLLSVAPVEETNDGEFPSIFFTLINGKGPQSLPIPRDASQLYFLASDVDRLASTGAAREAVDTSEKLLDTRERTTLLTIIGALVDEANLDLNQPYKAGQTVAAMLE